MASDGNTPAGGAPRFESVDRAMKLPVVEAAYNQVVNAYGSVKGANLLHYWGLSAAEVAVRYAFWGLTPYAQKLDKPLNTADQALVRVLDVLEARVPIVKEQPQQIYETARDAVTQRVQPHLGKLSEVLGLANAMELENVKRLARFAASQYQGGSTSWYSVPLKILEIIRLK